MPACTPGDGPHGRARSRSPRRRRVDSSRSRSDGIATSRRRFPRDRQAGPPGRIAGHTPSIRSPASVGRRPRRTPSRWRHPGSWSRTRQRTPRPRPRAARTAGRPGSSGPRTWAGTGARARRRRRRIRSDRLASPPSRTGGRTSPLRRTGGPAHTRSPGSWACPSTLPFLAHAHRNAQSHQPSSAHGPYAAAHLSRGALRVRHALAVGAVGQPPPCVGQAAQRRLTLRVVAAVPVIRLQAHLLLELEDGAEERGFRRGALLRGSSRAEQQHQRHWKQQADDHASHRARDHSSSSDRSAAASSGFSRAQRHSSVFCRPPSQNFS